MSNDFLVFAGAGGANVVSQGTYAALAALGPGFSTGTAFSDQCNKVWRQSSIISTAVAQLIADITGLNTVDDGTITLIEPNLLTTMMMAEFQFDVGIVNTYAINYTPALAAIYDGMVVRFRPINTNTGPSTLTVNGSTPSQILNNDGAPLIGNEIQANASIFLEWNADLDGGVWVILSTLGGLSSKPRIAGVVDGTGTIIYSSGDRGFTVTHPGTGEFTITFGLAFNAANYCILVTADTNGAPVTANTNTAADGSINITLVDPVGNIAVDTQFSFLIFK
jgi:hypothetical protein